MIDASHKLSKRKKNGKKNGEKERQENEISLLARNSSKRGTHDDNQVLTSLHCTTSCLVL